VIYDLIGRDRASPAFEKAGASASRMEKTVSKVSKAIVVAGEAIAAGAVVIGVESVKAAVAFQSSMEKIHTQAGASQADVDSLTKSVLKLAPATEQGPQQLSEALYHLKSVGLDNANAMTALKTASDLAAVGGANLEDTTNALAGAWRSGIKGAQTFGETAATVNAIIGAGNMTMTQFTDAIGTGILPSARSFGVSLKSVGAALALMTDEGIPADAAATRLRMSLSLLGAPSGVAQKQLASIGITGTQLADAMRGPQGIIGAISLLKTHLDASGLSASQQAALLSRAFGGGRSSSAILTMLNNLGVLEKKQEQINTTTGKYGGAVAAQRKTAQAQFDLLKSSLDTLGIKIGLDLLPPVTKFVTYLTSTVVPEVKRFGQDAANVLGPIAGWLGKAGLLAPLTGLAVTLLALKKLGVIKLGVKLSKLSSTAESAVSGTGMQTAADTMVTAAANMQTAADTMVGADTAGGAGGAAGAAAKGGAAGVAAKGSTAASATAGAAAFLKAGGIALVAAYLAGHVLNSFIPQETPAQQAAGKKAIPGWAQGFFSVFTGSGTKLPDWMQKNAPGAGKKGWGNLGAPQNETGGQVVAGLFKGTPGPQKLAAGSGAMVASPGSAGVIPHLWDVAYQDFQREFAGKITNWFTSSLPHAFGDIGGFFAGRWDSAYQSFFSGFASPLAHWFTVSLPDFFTQTIPHLFSTAWNGITKYLTHSDFGQVLANGLGGGIASGGKQIQNFLYKDIYQPVVNYFSGAGKWLWSKGSALVGGIGGGIAAGAKAVGGWLYRDIWKPVTGYFAKATSWLHPAGSGVVGGLGDGIWGRAKVIPTWLYKYIYQPVEHYFVKSTTWLYQHGLDIIQGLGSGIWARARSATSWLYRYIYQPVTGYFAKAGSWLWNHGWDLIQGLYNGIVARLKGIGTWVKGNIVNPIIKYVKQFFGIHSPSTVFHGIGFNMIAGLLRGIIAGDPLGAIKKIFGSAPMALAGLLEHGIISAAKLPGKAISALKGLGSSVLSELGSALSGVKGLGSDLLGLLGFGGGGGISTSGVANSSAYAALKSAAAKKGWTGAQWNALNYVEEREAGYSLTATNPSSGAYGMAQFINGPSEYAQYGGNSTTAAGQAVAMVNYIAQRYGNPVAAAAHERAFNWYAKGLAGQIFSTPTLIGVGDGTRPEKVTVTPLGANYGGSDGGAAPLIGTVNISPQEGPTVDEAMGALLFTMRRARQAGYPRR
jgi:TP901 family phage tail tape measure protein